MTEHTPSKDAFRQRMWNYLEDNNIAEFPRPVHHRIPNFKGANTAGEKAVSLEAFQKARTVKVNPDKPQEWVRYKTLETRKTLLVPTPRLRKGLFNKITPPDYSTGMLKKCATREGINHHSSPVGLEQKMTVDLIVIGSVAVSETGLRLGKGEGYADMEYAMMRSMRAVNQDTVVMTTVHDCQVIDLPEELFGSHDLTVDIIVTPTRVIHCCSDRAKPEGIYWNKLTCEQLEQIPILRTLREKERRFGRNIDLVKPNSH